MKFGGATLSTIPKIQFCANKIISKLDDYFPIVVVSAMGNTTHQLSDLISQITSNQNLSTDFILSTGEMLSAGFLSLCINKENHHAQPLSGWQIPIITNTQHGDATIEKVSTDNISQLIQQNIIPIITGFQGISTDNHITTLGKGASDLTAVSLAAAFDCDCYIYKNVDGVFTCDPEYQSSVKINKLSYENMQYASEHGAQVLFHKAVKYAKKHNVKIFVESAFNTSTGTTISNQPSKRNIITKQEAFLTILESGEQIQTSHSFISYDNKWCLFSSKGEYINYLNTSPNKPNQDIKYTKITLIHPNVINKEEFIRVAKQYSNIYSCMKYYSWICVENSKSSMLEEELHTKFI